MKAISLLEDNPQERREHPVAILFAMRLGQFIDIDRPKPLIQKQTRGVKTDCLNAIPVHSLTISRFCTKTRKRLCSEKLKVSEQIF